MTGSRPDIFSQEMEALFYAPFELREHGFVNGRPYIKKDAIRRRLSQIDPYWQITQPLVVKDDGKTIVVTGSIIVLGVQRYDIGTGSIATTGKDNAALPPLEITRNTIRGYKTAVSDILPRCAIQFGVGSYLKAVGRDVVDEGSLKKWLDAVWVRFAEKYHPAPPVQRPTQQPHAEQPVPPLTIVEGALKDAFPEQVSGQTRVVPEKDWAALHKPLDKFYATPAEVKEVYSRYYLEGKITDGMSLKVLVNFMREAKQNTQLQQQSLSDAGAAENADVPVADRLDTSPEGWAKFRLWAKPYLVRNVDEDVTDADLDTRLFRILQTIPNTPVLWSPTDFRGSKIAAMTAVVATYSDYDLPAFTSQVRTSAPLKKLEKDMIAMFATLKRQPV